MQGCLAAFLLAGLSVVGPEAKAQPGALDAPQAVGAFFNGVFPTNPPGEVTGWTTENAFPALSFVDPLWLTPIPGTGDLLLVGKNGQLWRFPNDPAATPQQVVKVLEWVSKTQVAEDQGFYSIVFHPEFGQVNSSNANFAYVCYNHRPDLPEAEPNRSYWRVSRFTWLPGSGTLDPGSEYVLMNQYDRCQWHNGGPMFFDNDGFLNIVCGDGGDSPGGGGRDGPDASLSRTQRLDFGLFSGVLRVDVDNDPEKSHEIIRQPLSPAAKPPGWPDSFTQGYGIPDDNPWLDPGGSVLEEYCALGLRSPHTGHYDPVTGEIWVGDVGGAVREELSRVVKGNNAQWGYREGFAAAPGNAAVPAIGIDTPPLLDYDRSVGNCIIGGMRYRGAKWNALLGGKVLYGDHILGRIWAATPGEPAVSHLLIEGFPTGQKVGLANFCTDSSGEIYLMNVNGMNQPGGTIRKLVLAGINPEPPSLLSQTGIFTDIAALTVAPGVIPYTVASPLWSDGAEKKRWLIVPNDGAHDIPQEKILFSEEGNWEFPTGTVIVKHFEVATNAASPPTMKRLETRFLVCTANGGKYGVTYRWNDEGTEATLLTSGGNGEFTFTPTVGDPELRTWNYPSRGDCLLCHNPASGQALGVRTAQLNMDFRQESTGRTANQLVTLNALGMFDRVLTSEEIGNFTAARAIGDATAPVEHRVRSYLDSNCAHCHQPGATVDYFDARLGTPLFKQGMIGGILRGHFNLGADGRYLKPADHALSAIHVRMASAATGTAMPPIGRNLVDQPAVDLLGSYLAGLTPEEFETTPATEARFVRLTALSEINGNPITSVAEFSVLDGSGFAIPPSELAVHDFDSQETVDEFAPAINAIDGDISTFWHTEWGNPQPPPPHHLTLDLGAVRAIGGFSQTPRQGMSNGRIADYQVDRSTDGVAWFPIADGTWGDDAGEKRYDGLVPTRKARCQIAGPVDAVNGAFEVTIVFDMDVVDFTPSDLSVTGGSVLKLWGGGYYYVATIVPAAEEVSIRVPADAANSNALGSRASAVLPVIYRNAFRQWAFENGVNGSDETMLDDEDGDGVGKLLEYAFNLDPAAADAGIYDPAAATARGLPRMILTPGIPEGQGLSLRFLRRKNAVDLTYRAQFGAGPDGFADAETPEIVETVDEEWESVTIADPAGSGPVRRFGRVVVTLDEP